MQQKAKYIIHNGEYVNINTFGFYNTNRAFRYGDSLFETMHAYGAKVQFLNDHLSRLTSSMLTLKMEIPQEFSIQYLDLKIHKLLDRNKLYQGARIRFTVFRSDGGFYTPKTNKVSYIIESESISFSHYTLNNKGLQIDLFRKIRKPINLLSGLKSANALIFVMAGIHKKENKLDDCIIINEKGDICEFISSNIFIVKNDCIYTPSLQSGCIPGIIRNQIIKIAENPGFKIFEKNIKSETLSSVDEVFSTNAIQGIQWIGGYKNKRYYNKVSTELIDILNEKTFK